MSHPHIEGENFVFPIFVICSYEHDFQCLSVIHFRVQFTGWSFVIHTGGK